MADNNQETKQKEGGAKTAFQPEESKTSPKAEAPKEEKEKAKTAPQPEEKKQEKKTKVSQKLAKIIEEIEKLSVLELSDLVKALEEKFGVSAVSVAPAAPAVATAGVSEAKSKEGPSPEQTVFNVILASTGTNKIPVIKALREIKPTLGLQEAKGITESAPKEILTQVNKKEATEAKQKLEAAGATVELK